MLVQFDVDKDAIKNSMKASATHCAIAATIKKKVKSNYIVTVTNRNFHILNHTESDVFRHKWSDEHIGQWISKWDCGDEVKPFSFEADIPDKYLRDDNS